MYEDIEIVKENVRLFSKILKRVAKTVLYILFLINLLFWMWFAVVCIQTPTENEYYVDTDGFVFFWLNTDISSLGNKLRNSNSVITKAS